VNVIDVGMVATPMTYFAAQHLGTQCSVMVTGSHNPPDYNGLKMVIDATTLSGDDIQALRVRIERGEFARGSGRTQSQDIAPAYFDRIAGDIHLARPMRIAVDCGNGVAGAFAPQLYRRLGCEVVELFCEVDGHFPNHHPDPSQPKNLEDLKRRLRDGDCELGLAFDGDGDRLGVVTPAGHVIYADRQLMLFAADVLTRVPGATIIYDVKSTRNLKPWITQHGGVPMLWKTGHSLIKSRMKEVGAALAGEMSGHTFFGERWYGFDDGLYAGARLLEILARHADPSAVLDALPDAISTPELQIACDEGEQHDQSGGDHQDNKPQEPGAEAMRHRAGRLPLGARFYLVGRGGAGRRCGGNKGFRSGLRVRHDLQFQWVGTRRSLLGISQAEATTALPGTLGGSPFPAIGVRAPSSQRDQKRNSMSVQGCDIVPTHTCPGSVIFSF